MANLDFSRQADILDNAKLSKLKVSLIGAGSVGSFIALTICKMGIRHIDIFDEDGVDTHNIPNQFYQINNIGDFKVDALSNILKSFCLVTPRIYRCYYKNQRLKEISIVATDNMESRRLVWGQFLKQPKSKILIEARMGAELGIVYCITKVDAKFYENTLYSDSEVKPLPCTARSIIYNVLMISSIVARIIKGIVCEEELPKEFVFDMKNMDSSDYPYMTRS